MRLIEKDLNQGDHIYVKGKRLLYSHHGIYAGERIVIHFKGAVKEKKDPVVRKTEIEKFLRGGNPARYPTQAAMQCLKLTTGWNAFLPIRRN